VWAFAAWTIKGCVSAVDAVLDEIARWSQMNDAERRAVNEQCQCRQTPKVGQGMVV